jgi:hypothetical protein
MDGDAANQPLQHRPVEDQEKNAEDRQCNACTTFPTSARSNFGLTILAHEGGNLFLRGESANKAAVRRCARLHLASRFRADMSPDKLFDYLDGKFTEAERARMEEQIAADSHLQRELALAREIHSRMQHSREVMLTDDTQIDRGAVIGRRVAIAFAMLVFLNVAFGLYAIGFMQKKRRATREQEQNQQELAQAVEKAAASALPTPSLDTNEITLSAPAKQRDTLASRIMAGAKESGGSAVKNLSNDNGLLLFAEIPAQQAGKFQEGLRKLGATVPAPASQPTASGKIIFQIRIVDNAK